MLAGKKGGESQGGVMGLLEQNQCNPGLVVIMEQNQCNPGLVVIMIS